MKWTMTQPSPTINRTMKKGTCLFQGIRNVIKEARKVFKYKDLRTEIQRMWNVKAKVISETRPNRNHFKIIQQIPRLTYLECTKSGNHKKKQL
jgi:hypothetical protein